MQSEATQILSGLCSGDRSSVGRLFEIIYSDFRGLARKYVGHHSRKHFLQPTELVHEAFVKLVDQKEFDWRGKSHFYAVGAQAMRHILVDHARRRACEKRGASRHRVLLREDLKISIRNDEDVLAIDEALEKLTAINELRAKIVELRFFAGMTMAEIAVALGVSKRTVEGHWTFARAWLRRELAEEDLRDDA